jgi:hypothetical protein
MSKWAAINDWLVSEQGNGGVDVLSSALDPSAGGGSGEPPRDAQQPGREGEGAPAPPLEKTNLKNPMEQPVFPNPDQKSGNMAEPVAPDMPDEKDSKMADANFEMWKNKFFKESVKGEVNQLLDMCMSMRNKDLDTYPRKFVEDNIQILFLRQNANIDKASQGIRKIVRDNLDHNNPANSLIQSTVTTIQPMPELCNVFIKMLGLYGMKADMHRKYIASLLGAVQVGSGGDNEDLIFNQREYSIRISTRMNSKFGMIELGNWYMDATDPEKFLSESEMEMMENGSPEEKVVLRKRVILESIADNFRMRSFYINVVDQSGTNYFVGIDFSNALRDGYNEGKIIVKNLVNEYSESFFDSEGSMVTLPDIKIMFNTNTGKLNNEGEPIMIENEFMSRRDGCLFLTATLDILKQASTSFQGITVKEIPFVGNPSDINNLVHCVPSAPEILLRNCA